LFGEEANKDLLIDFLNAVLPPEHRVTQLFFNNPEQLPDNIVDRKAVFDISCTGEHNESFTVEMQKAKQLYFKDRVLFYSAYSIQRQAQKGDWNFKLNPVFLVAILDFEYDQEEERRKLYRLVTLKDLIRYWDNKNVLDTARLKSETKGFAKGKAEREIEVARNLKQLGVDLETISQGTGSFNRRNPKTLKE
jgi:predicted transposase/invertase (TIGR01784 family)